MTPLPQRRLHKFAQSPYRFLSEALARRLSPSARLPVLRLRRRRTYVAGFSSWKQQLRRYLPDRDLVFLPRELSRHEFDARWRGELLAHPQAELLVWERNAPGFLLDVVRQLGRKVIHAEEGLLHALWPLPPGAVPFALHLDGQGPPADAAQASDLEALLGSHPFERDAALAARADRALQRLLALLPPADPAPARPLVPAETDARRVLVLGTDPARGHDGASASDAALVRLAAEENPGAEVLFLPASASARRRAGAGDLSELAALCTVVRPSIALATLLEGAERVYTEASPAAFEALLRGARVVTTGCPFYAGWGLTEDRQPCSRRQRRLQLRDLFAATFLLYPRYHDPETGATLSFEDALDRLARTSPGGGSPPLPASAAALPRTEPTAPGGELVPSSPAVPDWYRPALGPVLRQALDSGRPVFLYVPWIVEHGDSLIGRLADEHYLLAPFDFARGTDSHEIRRQILRHAREQPHHYRRLVARRLVPLRSRIEALVFTFDWAPVMRLIAGVCEELEIPRILVPHESVFVDRQKYYWDPTAQASVPVADLVLGWGRLQRDIYVERGYPAERFLAVGAPKFDAYRDFRPQLSRRQFCRLFGLDPSRRVVLFAAQPLDSQLDAKEARQSQRTAVRDLLAAAEERGMQLLVRMPPSKEEILGPELQEELADAPHAAVDDASCYLVGPEEALFHADLVTSINSTMLFEATLLSRPALSLQYVEFERLWQHAGIPAARDAGELAQQIDALLHAEWRPSAEGLAWAAEMYSTGTFDGCAAARIRAELAAIALGRRALTLRPDAVTRVFERREGALDVVAIPSSEETSQTTQRYLLGMIGARTRVDSSKGMEEIRRVASVDLFLQWGITPSRNKSRQTVVQRALGAPWLIIEDGFIRSVDIGLSKEPGLSIILDDTTAYYDATRPSRLQRRLESGPELTPGQASRARAAIDLIVRHRVSKYNHAPDLRLDIGQPGRPKMLLVDQRYGDQSVASGLADEKTYERMLLEALKRPGWDVIVKRHPDAIKGGKSSYFSDERLAFARYVKHLHCVDFDVNPFSLFDLVEEVHVATSGMGFEALMAGKQVHCHGMPFYAGWGATQDRLQVPGRTRRRSVEALFHFAYVEASRYFHPGRGTLVEVEDLVDHIVAQRGW